MTALLAKLKAIWADSTAAERVQMGYIVVATAAALVIGTVWLT